MLPKLHNKNFFFQPWKTQVLKLYLSEVLHVRSGSIWGSEKKYTSKALVKPKKLTLPDNPVHLPTHQTILFIWNIQHPLYLASPADAHFVLQKAAIGQSQLASFVHVSKSLRRRVWTGLWHAWASPVGSVVKPNNYVVAGRKTDPYMGTVRQLQNRFITLIPHKI